MIYTQSARFYDALNRGRGKDYAREARDIAETIVQRKRSNGKCVLDVGCGTGRHIEMLRPSFECEGLDVDRSMLDIARERNPDITFHQADMIGFNLGKKYDAIVCLYSAIANLPNVGRLEQTLQTFARHLQPGGVILIEPWLSPEEWHDGSVEALFVDEPELKVARMSVSRRDGKTAVLNYHYMVASRDGIRTFQEPHRLTLFTDEEYRQAFRSAHLIVDREERGPTGRGLYVGSTPQWEAADASGRDATSAERRFTASTQGVIA